MCYVTNMNIHFIHYFYYNLVNYYYFLRLHQWKFNKTTIFLLLNLLLFSLTKLLTFLNVAVMVGMFGGRSERRKKQAIGTMN